MVYYYSMFYIIKIFDQCEFVVKNVIVHAVSALRLEDFVSFEETTVDPISSESTDRKDFGFDFGVNIQSLTITFLKRLKTN